MPKHPKAFHFSWLGSELCCLLLGPPGSTDDLLLLQISCVVVWQSRDLQLSRNTLYLFSPLLCFLHDLCVYRDDLLTS